VIGRIRGVLVEKRPPRIMVDCHGVGYELEAPMTTICVLPDIDQEVTLMTHLIVRDDAHLLFAFATEPERRLFRILIKVSGVGAKVALAILSGIQVEEFVKCVHAGEANRLTGLPGIGKKTAERLIVEMRDRVNDWTEGPVTVSGIESAVARDAVGDAISALIGLGYKPQEASRSVHALDSTNMSSEDIIREALKGFINN
jgi:Holliday junction DNA helicase RuvA